MIAHIYKYLNICEPLHEPTVYIVNVLYVAKRFHVRVTLHIL